MRQAIRSDLSTKTGLGPSKPVFAPDHRPSPVVGLDETLNSLDGIADILVASEDGPEQQCREIVRAAADHLGARWVFLALRHEAMPFAAPRLVALDPGGGIIRDARDLPTPVRSRLHWALACAGSLERGEGEVFLPLLVGRTVCGVLGAFQGQAPAHRRPVNETDLPVLRIMANQAVMALQCSQALRRNGQVLEELKGLYEQAQHGDRTVRQQVIDDERRRLARELHDSVAQHVLSAGLAIEWCRTEVPVGSPVYDRLGEAKQLTRTAVDYLRVSIQALSARAEDEDLPGLLRRLADVHASSCLELTVRIEGHPVRLAAAAERSLFRIASECVFNTAVHSRAQKAILHLEYETNVLRLRVADDGDGEPEALRRVVRQEVPGLGGGYHRGLTDVAARVRELGAVLAVERSPLGGIAVDVTLPLASVRAVNTPAAPGGRAAPPGGGDG